MRRILILLTTVSSAMLVEEAMDTADEWTMVGRPMKADKAAKRRAYEHNKLAREEAQRQARIARAEEQRQSEIAAQIAREVERQAAIARQEQLVIAARQAESDRQAEIERLAQLAQQEIERQAFAAQLAINKRHLAETVNVLYTSFDKEWKIPGWSVLKAHWPMLALFPDAEDLFYALPEKLETNTAFCNSIVHNMSLAISAHYMQWHLHGIEDPLRRHPKLLDFLNLIQKLVLSELYMKVGKTILSKSDVHNRDYWSRELNEMTEQIRKISKLDKAPKWQWSYARAAEYNTYGSLLYHQAMEEDIPTIATKAYPPLLFSHM